MILRRAHSQKPHQLTQLSLKAMGLTPDVYAVISEFDAKLADILADAKSSVPQPISRYCIAMTVTNMFYCGVGVSFVFP